MRKIYHLSSCSTCQKIIKDLKLKEKNFVFQDIKTEKITSPQLDEMIKMAGSIEPLFSTKAIKYRELGLKDKKLTTAEKKNFILDEYTFLKRPVIIIDSEIFIGNSPETISQVRSIV
ncbi:MAG TPA: ArsC/Spx/MgsR family protein [Bacteroidia bacterium]|nr:ArsC/Spx/MgsR family protein [Bacteroidia bacterium]